MGRTIHRVRGDGEAWLLAREPSPTVALKSISRSQTSLMAALGNI